MALITIRTFNTSAEAHIFMAQLENEGIRCFLFDENTVTINPLYNYTIGGVKLKIDEKDLTLAKEIYDANSATHYTNESGDKITCPKCNSSAVYSGISQTKGWRAILGVIVLLVLSIVPSYRKTGYQCKSCGEQFTV